MVLSEIFVFEDDLEVCRVLEVLFLKWDYDVFFFVDGDLLFVVVWYKVFVCILLDFQLFGKLGFEVFVELYVVEYLVFVFMMLGYGSIEIVVKVVKFGVVQFFEKLFKLCDLIDSIERVLVVFFDYGWGDVGDVVGCDFSVMDLFMLCECQIWEQIMQGNLSKDIV